MLNLFSLMKNQKQTNDNQDYGPEFIPGKPVPVIADHQDNADGNQDYSGQEFPP
jgi:hypothetical protein